jgi:hypothetical protein
MVYTGIEYGAMLLMPREPQPLEKPKAGEMTRTGTEQVENPSPTAVTSSWRR